MAHFAQLDDNDFVIQVVVISNQDLLDSDGNESEYLGIEVCKSIFGQDTKWVQTSYNGNFRGNYAGFGYAYDYEMDIFYDPNPPYPSWNLDKDGQWKAPIPYPEDGKEYAWDEGNQLWFCIN